MAESEQHSSWKNPVALFSSSVDELKKVSTPTRAETFQATLVTVIMLVFVAVCLAILDVVFGKMMAAILS